MSMPSDGKPSLPTLAGKRKKRAGGAMLRSPISRACRSYRFRREAPSRRTRSLVMKRCVHPTCRASGPKGKPLPRSAERARGTYPRWGAGAGGGGGGGGGGAGQVAVVATTEPSGHVWVAGGGGGSGGGGGGGGAADDPPNVPRMMNE